MRDLYLKRTTRHTTKHSTISSISANTKSRMILQLRLLFPVPSNVNLKTRSHLFQIHLQSNISWNSINNNIHNKLKINSNQIQINDQLLILKTLN